ncbi:hypothetical protein E5Q_06393 [Mixia osmundae IAM 14324]|uniref:DNA damage-binding protein CMR1 n=1 Tax=Mixia osmundae (strain CBS 9802 / IAM 14324 / JCM 22182 / KY 12970) TaxID=764103 RepID=G7EA29_MIXOS|nr:hypothetical protein E5Q_06393 [Mixia osmundae IAM 14324]
MASMSEYEKQRLENIRQNEELLKSLSLPATQPARKARAPAPKKKDDAKKRKREPREAAGPARRSSRVAGLAVDSQEAEKAQEAREAEIAALAEEMKRKKGEDRLISLVSGTNGRTIEVGQDDELQTGLDALLALIRQSDHPRPSYVAVKGEAGQTVASTPVKSESKPDVISPKAKRGKVKQEDIETDTTTPLRAPKVNRKAKVKDGQVELSESAAATRANAISPKDVTSLRESLSTLVGYKCPGVVPSRIYSMAVHPTVNTDLVFAGDKNGNLGCLQFKLGASEEEQAKSWTFPSHNGSISCIRFDPVNSHSVYTSSYDCSVRRLDFETKLSTQVLDVDAIVKADFEGESLLSAFDFTRDGNEIWLSDTRGGILHHDMREAQKKTRRWLGGDKKIGCVSLNPINERYIVTAHLDRDVRVWDARALSNCSVISSSQTNVKDACLARYEHGYACSSAYWDPSGSHILTTSYDNKCRIWDVDSSSATGEIGLPAVFEPAVSVSHDNQTGRYVSVFKAQWSPNPDVLPHFTIGNMNHRLDVIAANGDTIANLWTDAISATQAVTQSHPNLVNRAYSGNGSGAVMIWAPEIYLALRWSSKALPNYTASTASKHPKQAQKAASLDQHSHNDRPACIPSNTAQHSRQRQASSQKPPPPRRASASVTSATAFPTAFILTVSCGGCEMVVCVLAVILIALV